MDMRPTHLTHGQSVVLCGWYMGLLSIPGSSVCAQQEAPVVIIPITKERVSYYNMSEDGTRVSCGIRLYGSFPVYKGRTNISDYSRFIPGVQNPGSWRLDSDNRFRFYAHFNGRDGPAATATCNHTIGGAHDELFARLGDHRERGHVPRLECRGGAGG